MRQRIFHAAALLAVAASLSACALAEDKETLAYVPNEAVAPVPGAQGVVLAVSAKDARVQFTDRISTKKNGYGMEMARITSTNDVVELVRSSVERELKAEGFTIGQGGSTVAIELQNFYNNFRYSMTWTAAAEVAFSVKVRTAAGALLYTGNYDATATLDGVFLASGSNAKEALQKALTQALRKMIDDRALQAALLSSGAVSSDRGPRT
jgi:uncharacterized lipoprotein YajG